MKVLFFAQIRDFTRCGSAEIQTTAAQSEEEFWATLAQQFPGIAKFRSSTRLARNGAFATPSETFHPDDEIALLPPVSGG